MCSRFGARFIVSDSRVSSLQNFYFFVYQFLIVFQEPHSARMDLQMDVQEVIVRTRRVRIRKTGTSKVLEGLVKYLCLGCHFHMLRWLDVKKRMFQVKLVNKNCKDWTKKDISLFTALDSLFKTKKRQKIKYEENTKNRFKSNMCKLKKYIKELQPSRKLEKSVTIKTYEIIYLPPNVEKLIESLIRSKSSEELRGGNYGVLSINSNSNFGVVEGEQRNFKLFNSPFIKLTDLNINVKERCNNGVVAENSKNFKSIANGESRNLIEPSIGGKKCETNVVEDERIANFITGELINLNNPIIYRNESSNSGPIAVNINGELNLNNNITNINADVLIPVVKDPSIFLNTVKMDNLQSFEANIVSNKNLDENNITCLGSRDPFEENTNFMLGNLVDLKDDFDGHGVNYKIPKMNNNVEESLCVENFDISENDTMFVENDSKSTMECNYLDISKSVPLPNALQSREQSYWILNNFPEGFGLIDDDDVLWT